MTLGISVGRILDGVYAHSAYAHGPEKDSRGLLSREHAGVLARVAVDVFLELAVRMAGYVADVDIDDPDVLQLTVGEEFAAVPSTMARTYLEACVTQGVLARGWSLGGDTQRGRAMEAAASVAEGQLARLFQEHRRRPGAICPAWLG